MTRRLGTIAAIAAATFGFGGNAAAQTYPERTVELVVPSTPGSSADILGRVLADSLSAQLGQRFIVLNKPGAGGVARITDFSCKETSEDGADDWSKDSWKDAAFSSAAGAAARPGAGACAFFSRAATPAKFSSEGFASGPAGPDHVIRHTQAGTNSCRIQ